MSRRFIFFFFAIALSGATVFIAQQWLHAQLAGREAGQLAGAATPAAPRVQVLVAKSEIPVGTFLTADSLRWQEWPQDGIADSYIVAGKGKPEDFTGAVARSRLSAGEPITADRVVHAGDRGFMAAILTPGTRAVTVNVTPSTGMAGFVSPGDHVDLILSMVIQSSQKDAPSRHMSETVITDLRVLAMDQRISDDKKDVAAVPKTATLEVTPKQAELVAVASELGLLSLSLRSLADGKDGNVAATNIPTWDNEATHQLFAEAAANVQHRVDVVRGSDVSQVMIASPISGVALKP